MIPLSSSFCAPSTHCRYFYAFESHSRVQYIVRYSEYNIVFISVFLICFPDVSLLRAAEREAQRMRSMPRGLAP